MKTLIIDTSDNKQISVGLRIDNKEYIKRQKVDIFKAQATLPMIEKIISEKDLSLKDLNSIEVNTGPGSFTGIRVGISIANALGFSLGIPVNGKNLMHFVEARYS
jgi:tRNA threonylcarbamoyladenosine biosynthesis protein TsaB